MTDLWIYRDGKRRESTRDVVAALARERSPVSALVACGEIEAALADVGTPAASSIAGMTDAYARLVLEVPALVPSLRTEGWPDTLVLGTPEGFAYYGLHPTAFAKAIDEVPGADVLVVGVRSIGTTLSAIACAALERRGVRAERVTVRPVGSPFARRLDDAVLPRAFDTVLVVDEGPGLSGSTLVAVAEAYERAGAARVVIACTKPPVDLPPAIASRWRRFRTLVANAPPPAPKGKDVGGGAWRFVHGIPDAPACAAFERRKVLVGARLWKQDGLGLRASAAIERGRALAAEGLGLPPTDEGDGWTSTRWTGRPLSVTDLDESVMEAIVRSCVIRTRWGAPATDPLRPAIAKNARILFRAREGSIPTLDIVSPALVDGRLQPHEFLRVGDRIVKTDALTHGDDHFFPGPTDIAWDLAGAIVEWKMRSSARARLLDAYRSASGDDVRPRIDGWIRAYEIQRTAFAAFTGP